MLAIGPLIALFIADGFFRKELYSYSPTLYWVFDILKFVVLPACATYFLFRGYRIKPYQYGLRGVAENETWIHFSGLIFFLAIILTLTYHVTVHISWWILQPHVDTPFFPSILPDGLFRFPVVLYFALTAGVAEEILCRGLPLLYLEERYGQQFSKAGYVLCSAFLFSMAHWENGPHEVVGTFCYGVLSGILYLQLRDLWPFVFAHTLTDIWGFA